MIAPSNMVVRPCMRELRLGEWVGVLIAIASSSLGGTAAAVTRYLVLGSADGTAGLSWCRQRAGVL